MRVNTKRILAGFLALLMVLAMMPSLALADIVESNVCKIGNQGYDTLEGAISQAGTGDTITMIKNVTLSAVVEIGSGKEIVLDLAGYTISGNEATRIINNSGKLTITDSSATLNNSGFETAPGTGCLTKGKSVSGAYGACITNSGELIFNAGTISDCVNNGSSGPGAIQSSNKLTINGGTIKNNVCENGEGGGGAIKFSGTFNMTGGEISGNTAYGTGGGVFSSDTAVFEMSGGKIKDNSSLAKSVSGTGGGVYISNKGTFNLSGTAVISNNKVTGSNGNGAGVYVTGASSFTMTGGTIEKNTASNQGGGIKMAGNGNGSPTIYLSGGKIDHNTATENRGGGIMLEYANAVISGGEITNNTCGTKGGAIDLANGGSLNITAGKITGNTASEKAKGNSIEVTNNSLNVYIGQEEGKTTIIDGTIILNNSNATVAGGRFGDYISSSKTGFISGGVFTKTSKENTSENLIITGKTFVPNTDTATKTDYPWTIGVPKVAKNVRTGDEYETLLAAVQAAQAGDTIKLLNNVSIPHTGVVSTDWIGIDKSLTIDGQKESGTGRYSITTGEKHLFTLSTDDTNLKFELKNCIINQNYASDGGYVAYSAGNAKVVVDNCEINSAKTLYNLILRTTGDGHASDINGVLEFTNNVVNATATSFLPNLNAGSKLTGNTFNNIGNARAASITAEATGAAQIVIKDNTFKDCTKAGLFAVNPVSQNTNLCIKNNTFTNINTVLKVDSNTVLSSDTEIVNAGGKAISVSAGKLTITGGKYIGQTSAYEKTDTGTLEISGGWFSTKVYAADCAADYVPTDEKDNAPDANAKFTVEIPQVAKVGDKTYKSLALAIEAAKDVDTIQMLLDTTENVTIPEGKKIILSLNGKTISGGTASNKPAITNYGTLVIYDVSDAKTGTIKREDTTSTLYYVIDNRGSMWILSGTIANDIASSEHAGIVSLIKNGDAYDKNPSAILKIYDGTISNNNVNAINDFGKELTIYGGTISSQKYAIFTYGNMHVEGGTINGAVSIGGYKDNEIDLSGTATIAGGTFNNSIFHVEQHPSYQATDKPSLTITKGLFNGCTFAVGENDGITFVKNNDIGILEIGGGYYTAKPTEYLKENCAAASVTATFDSVSYKYLVGLNASSTSSRITAGKFTVNPVAYIADGYKVESSGDQEYPYAVAKKESGEKDQKEIVVEQKTETGVSEKIEKTEEIQVAEEVLKDTNVVGVADALTKNGCDEIIQEAIDDELSDVTEASVKNAKQIDIAITVEAEVTAIATVTTTTATEKIIEFELTPYAVVTTIATDGTQLSSSRILVDNDYLAKTAAKAIKVTLGSEFEPKQAVHIREDEVKEVFVKGSKASYADKTFAYDAAEKVVTLEITQFSSIQLLADEVYANVSFDANGGSGTMETLGVEKGKTLTLPESKFTAPKGMKFKYWTIDGKKCSAGDEVKVTADITVKAEWEQIAVTGDFTIWWVYVLIGVFGIIVLSYGITRVTRKEE